MRKFCVIAAIGLAMAYAAKRSSTVATAQAPPAGAQAPAPPGGQAPGAPGVPGAPGGGGGRGRGGPTPGSLLWTEQCAGCHGNDAAGGRAPSLFDQKWLDSTTDARIANSIKNGVPNTEMEGFKSLTDEQIFQLIAHIRTQTGAPLRPRAAFNESPDGTVIKSAKQTFKVELVTDGLMTPWALAFLPDGRMLVTERDGRLQVVDKAGKKTVIEGTPKAHVQQDGGYLDVEVHPQYARNGWIYLAYVEDQPGYVAPPPAPPAPAPDPAAAPAPQAGGGGGGRGGGRGGPPQVPSMTVVVRGKLSKDNKWTAQQTIFRASNDLYTTSGAHYGSRLLFDTQNHLFFTLGERNGNNPNYAQDLTKPLGKVHRFNDDGTVPKDNPFVNTPGAVASIWTYGHRNPEGLAWDPVSGHLWESEHGPNTADEVNVLIKGHNYGWNLASKQGPPQYKLSLPDMDDPVVYYTPTFAPAGISFYSGTRYPGWKNTSLFVCGLAGQALRRLEVKGDTVVTQEVVFDSFGRVRDIVQGPDGYFYIAVQNPTGVPNPAGGNIQLSASTPGRVIRLIPQ
ncbi:MAG: PQQ-dependent sugar dehydrogenase [Acidobacteriota bacterium]